jgi:sugar O-acyltransferase (sialic acid O-acetyltransferase NeuD family)
MIIFGAGSLGIQICDQLITNGINKNEIVFYDNRANALKLLPDNFKTISTEEELKQLIRQDSEIFIGIGHPHLRRKISSQMMDLGGNIGSVKSSSAQISNFCKIGQGYYIQPNVNIAHNVKIGDMAVIHANSIISHDVVIGNNLNLSQNVNIMKDVQIGDSCFIGANVMIMPGVKIGKRVVIGAGSVIAEDLSDFESIKSINTC